MSSTDGKEVTTRATPTSAPVEQPPADMIVGKAQTSGTELGAQSSKSQGMLEQVLKMQKEAAKAAKDAQLLAQKEERAKQRAEKAARNAAEKQKKADARQKEKDAEKTLSTEESESAVRCLLRVARGGNAGAITGLGRAFLKSLMTVLIFHTRDMPVERVMNPDTFKRISAMKTGDAVDAKDTKNYEEHMVMTKILECTEAPEAMPTDFMVESTTLAMTSHPTLPLKILNDLFQNKPDEYKLMVSNLAPHLTANAKQIANIMKDNAPPTAEGGVSAEVTKTVEEARKAARVANKERIAENKVNKALKAAARAAKKAAREEKKKEKDVDSSDEESDKKQKQESSSDDDAPTPAPSKKSNGKKRAAPDSSSSSSSEEDSDDDKGTKKSKGNEDNGDGDKRKTHGGKSSW